MIFGYDRSRYMPVPILRVLVPVNTEKQVGVTGIASSCVFLSLFVRACELFHSTLMIF